MMWGWEILYNIVIVVCCERRGMMFRIGEFSKLMQVSIRMLRYYDEKEILKPAEIDSWTGYRMYSVDQIPILNKIIALLKRRATCIICQEFLYIERDRRREYQAIPQPYCILL